MSALRLASVLLAAVALGIWADEGQRAPGFAGYLPELGTPWLVLAFAAGRSIPRWARWLAPVAAAASILLGLASYALFVHRHYGVAYEQVSGGDLGYWTWLGLGVGALAGMLAFASRTGAAPLAWAALAAVPVAEIRLVERWGIDAHVRLAVTVLLIVVFLLLAGWAFVAMRRIPLIFGPLTALAAVVGWVGIGVLLDLGAL